MDREIDKKKHKKNVTYIIYVERGEFPPIYKGYGFEIEKNYLFF